MLEHLRSRLHLVPRYRQKLAYPPFESGRPLWIDDPTFNLEYHLRHSALPSPGTEQQLYRLAARIGSQQLDRSKPLWECWFVEGLEHGRFALIFKTHHALVDGVSGVDLATVLFDLAAKQPQEASPPWEPHPEPTSAELLAGGIAGLAKTAYSVTEKALAAATNPAAAIDAVREAVEGIGEVVWAGLNPAPETPLNVEIGPHRRYAIARHAARGLPLRQARARRHRQRHRADDRLRRARPLAARPRDADRGTRAARARAGLDPPAGRSATSSATRSS